MGDIEQRLNRKIEELPSTERTVIRPFELLQGRSAQVTMGCQPRADHILRTGAPWRHLPERYGPRTTLCNRYNRWAKAGVWLAIFDAVAETSPHSLHLIDSSIVRAHQHAAGAKRGQDRAPGSPAEG